MKRQTWHRSDLFYAVTVPIIAAGALCMFGGLLVTGLVLMTVGVVIGCIDRSRHHEPTSWLRDLPDETVTEAHEGLIDTAHRSFLNPENADRAQDPPDIG